MSWSPWKSVVMCIKFKPTLSRGIFLNDNPFHFSTPTFMLQIGLCSISTGAFDHLLRPLGLSSFFSQMLGALFLGPSGFMSIGNAGELVFSKTSLYIFETVANFALIFFLFLVGLKMDLQMVRNSGRKCLIIGFIAYVTPMLISMPVAFMMSSAYQGSNPRLAKMFPSIAYTSSMTSMHVIICALADLKLLNTEMGRLAVASATVTNTITMALNTLNKASQDANKFKSSSIFFLRLISLVMLCLCAKYILKPIMMWMIKRTPEGSSVKQVYIFVVFWLIMATAIGGQVAGQPNILGPILFGIAIPVGPPLGTTIEQKLESVVMSILLPLYYVAAAGRIALPDITYAKVVVVTLVMLLAFLGKLIGTILSSLYCNLPLHDAFVLGLMMVTQGIVDIIHFRSVLIAQHINIEVYSIMCCTAVMLTGLTTPLLKYIYDPSRRYTAFKKSITQSTHESEFRILACVYYESNAPTIMNLLQASNPTITSPIYLYLLHLIELQRVTVPILIAHKRDETNSFHYNRSKNVINAFRCLEVHNDSTFSLSSFTSLCPFATMHDDICSVATEKRTSLIILPFHRQLNRDGLLESIYPIRNVNHNVLRIAPCTVGILVDQQAATSTTFMAGTKYVYHIAILFLGGTDDREVLTYGMKMVEHPCTELTVIHFRPSTDKNTTKNIDTELDAEMISRFKRQSKENSRMTYKDQVVKDGIAIIKWLNLMEESYDLMMVGKQHESTSPLVQGLAEWTEFPELGCVGDMLLTSDVKNSVSILVLQQQFCTELSSTPSILLTL